MPLIQHFVLEVKQLFHGMYGHQDRLEQMCFIQRQIEYRLVYSPLLRLITPFPNWTDAFRRPLCAKRHGLQLN